MSNRQDCRDDLFIAHLNAATSRISDRANRHRSIARLAYVNAVGDRVSRTLSHFAVAVCCVDDRRSRLRLHSDHLWQALDETGLVKIIESLPQSADYVSIANRDKNFVWNIPVQLLADLERRGLLALSGKWIEAGAALI